MVIVPDLSLQTIGIMIGIFAILHGIVVIGLDFAIHNIHIPFYGIMSGILSIIDMIMIRKDAKDVAKAFEDSFKEIKQAN